MSKATFHCMTRGLPAGAIEAGLRSAKFVNVPPPDNLPAEFVSVWRWVFSPDNANSRYGESPELVAGDWLSKLAEHLIDIPKATYIEILNEPDCENAQQAAWLNKFYLTCMQRLEAIGRKCAIFSFGTGRPSMPVVDPLGVEIWTALTPAMRYAKQNDHIAIMHGYEYDPHGTSNFLRYRSVYKWLPADAHPRLFIGEWGLDGDKGPFNDSRWRAGKDDPDSEYMRVIREYDAEVMRDDYVIGFSIFTLGGWWPLYDISGSRVPQMVLDYVRSNPTPVPVPPTPTPEPAPESRLKVGDTYVVIADTLRVRNAPAGLQVATTVKGDKSTIVQGPVAKKWQSQILNWYQRHDGNWIAERQSGEWYLEKIEIPVPPSTGVNLISNGDYTLGFTTPFIDTRFVPPRTRDNVRVPIGHWLTFLDDVIEPRLPRQDPFAPWLAPESVLRSGDIVKYPFTERLPDDELTLYLNAQSPIAMHYFKLYGIMWFEQGVTLDSPAGRYEYSIESYCDTHVKDHKFITNESIASEWRLNVSGQTNLEWDNGDTPPPGENERLLFGHWRTIRRVFEHIGGPLSVSFEFRARWGVEHVGVFLRNERLVRLS